MNEVKPETLVKLDNLDMMVNKVKTDLLVCRVCPVKWVLVVSPVPEASLDFPVPLVSQEVKVLQVPRATRVHLDNLVVLDSPDLPVQLALLDHKVFSDPLDLLDLVVNPVYLDFLVLMVFLDTRVTTVLLEPRVMLDLPDPRYNTRLKAARQIQQNRFRRVPLVSRAPAVPKVTRDLAVLSARRATKVTRALMVRKVTWARKENVDLRVCKVRLVWKVPKVPKVSKDHAARLVLPVQLVKRANLVYPASPDTPDLQARKVTKELVDVLEHPATRETEYVQIRKFNRIFYYMYFNTINS